MRWQFLGIPLFFFFLIGATVKTPQILAWLHIPQPQKLKAILPSSMMVKEKIPPSISVVVEPSLQQQIEYSPAALQNFPSFIRLRGNQKRTTLAFGSLDFIPVYAHFARDRNASRNAAIAVRLGIDELEGLDVEIAENKSNLSFSSVLHYRGMKEGLLASIGKPIPLKLPTELPPQMVGYSVFSVIPAQLYWTVKRCANYLWGGAASLVHLQMRGLESQMNKLMDVDILGESSQPWEIIEMKTPTGSVVGVLRASVQDPAGFEQWLKLAEPVLPLIRPNLKLEAVSVGKISGYRLVGSPFPFVLVVHDGAVVVAPSSQTLEQFLQIRSKAGGISSELGIGRGLRWSAGGGIHRLGPDLTGGIPRDLDKMLQLLQGVRWNMVEEPGSIQISGEAKWSQRK